MAISTPAGRGGIGIVRLSGPAAKEIAETLVQLKRPLEAGRVRFGVVMDTDSDAVLDEAVVTYFRGPRSYTGEDVVEIAAHGAPVLLDAMVRRCVAAGARLAGPGEFTERAFFAGRVDLTQAEAVDDLIQATTLEQARMAARQMGGGLSRQVRPVKEQLIGLIAEMEAGIDFAEDDLDVMGSLEMTSKLRMIEAPLKEMEESFAYGRVLREGFKLAIVGRPNAGKSSLFNRLIKRDRAIVTAQPGTTRDPVAERMEFAGIPVEVVDTAGLRIAADEAEALGVDKSREAIAEADVVLLVVAADVIRKDKGMHEEDWQVIREFGGAWGRREERGQGEGMKRKADPSTAIRSAQDDTSLEGSAQRFARDDTSRAGLVVVMNKMDLVRSDGERFDGLNGAEYMGGAESLGVLRLRAARIAQNDGCGEMARDGGLVVVETSAVKGTGIEELRAAVLRELRAIAPMADTAPLTNLRQHGAIGAAVKAVRAAIAGIEHEVPHEMVLIDLHEALEALDQLTGTTHTEEILGLIFSKFCIGK